MTVSTRIWPVVLVTTRKEETILHYPPLLQAQLVLLPSTTVLKYFCSVLLIYTFWKSEAGTSAGQCPPKSQ